MAVLLTRARMTTDSGNVVGLHFAVDYEPANLIPCTELSYRPSSSSPCAVCHPIVALSLIVQPSDVRDSECKTPGCIWRYRLTC